MSARDGHGINVAATVVTVGCVTPSPSAEKYSHCITQSIAAWSARVPRASFQSFKTRAHPRDLPLRVPACFSPCSRRHLRCQHETRNPGRERPRMAIGPRRGAGGGVFFHATVHLHL